MSVFTCKDPTTQPKRISYERLRPSWQAEGHASGDWDKRVHHDK
jgi:hypothetical protein